MKKEFNLSEKIEFNRLHPKDVKEFIKDLKSALCSEMFQRPQVKESMLDRIPQPEIMREIDKLAGDDLK